MTTQVTHLGLKDLVQAELDSVIDQSIDELNLLPRTHNALTRYGGIVTIRDLMDRTKEDLLRLKGFGRHCLRDVRDRLRDLDLDLKPRRDIIGTAGVTGSTGAVGGTGPMISVRDLPALKLDGEVDRTLVSPTAKIVADLVSGWDKDKALVLADWCEELEFRDAQKELRKGYPTERCRAYVEFLGFLFGLATPPRRHDWEQNWAPERKEQACAVCGYRNGYRRYVNGVLTDKAYCETHRTVARPP